MGRLPVLLLSVTGVVVDALAAVTLSALWQRERVRHLAATGRRVGRMVFDWTDASRVNPYRTGDASPAHRRLLVWLWYPATPGTGTPARYAPTDWLHALAAEHGPARLFMQDLTRVRTGAASGATVRRKGMPAHGYPEVILSTGYGQPVFLYSALCEALVRGGYVVAAIETPYDTPVTVYPDGTRVVRTKAASLPEGSSAAAMEPALRSFTSLRAQDIAFVRQRLGAVDTDRGPLAGAIDTGAVYLVGHSLGGAASAAAADAMPGIRAAVDLDGDLVGAPANRGVRVPFLAVLGGAEKGTWSPGTLRRSLRPSANRGAQVVAVAGMKHFDFTDDPFTYQPLLRALGLLGPARPVRAHRTIARLIEAFFARPAEESRTIPAYARSHQNVEEVRLAAP